MIVFSYIITFIGGALSALISQNLWKSPRGLVQYGRFPKLRKEQRGLNRYIEIE